MSRAGTGAALLLLLALSAGCGAGRYIPFWGSQNTTLLVRHARSAPLRIWYDQDPIGVAESGRITCFPDLPPGSHRLRATATGDTVTVRASRVVLPPDEAMLWDVDHDQLLDGRVHAPLCDEDEGGP